MSAPLPESPQAPRLAPGATPAGAGVTAEARDAHERRQKSWTILELLRWTTGHFAARGIDTARLDAECLLAHALGSDRLRLYLDFEKPVEAAERAHFRELVRRRAGDRVPVSQLIGRREFWSLSLLVSPQVLTPRPDTETLVAVALALAPEREAALDVLEIGTGSGAIALAFATERPRARIVATDASPAALAVARANAARLGLEGRIRFAEGDAYAAAGDERFDLVVSNPPYLADAEAVGLAPELAHEPREALFAGPLGTELLERLATEAPGRLRPGGAIALEIAPQQARAVAGFLARAALEGIATHPDLARRPRVVSARMPSGSDGTACGGEDA